MYYFIGAFIMLLTLILVSFGHTELVQEANLDAINKTLNICHFEDDSFGTCYPDR